MKRLTMHRYTMQDIMALGPCQPTEDDPDDGYPEHRIRALFGDRRSVTLLDICDDERVLVEDRQWVLYGLLPERIVHEAACRYAEHALERERAAGREPDQRSWAAIKAKRKWLRGEISDIDLKASRVAAWAAVMAVGEDGEAAASAAAWATVGGACGAAGGAANASSRATWDGAQTAERRWQLNTLRAMIEEMPL